MRRIESLDVLRGIAILGTLGTNVWLFTDRNGPYGSIAGTFVTGGAAETFLHYLANGKFLALLSVVFGVGLEIQYRSAVRAGRRWPGWYLWRAALLFVEGVLHYVLVFEFDVLMGYAVVSVLVAFLVGRSDRVVRRWMIGAGALHLLLETAGTVRLFLVGPGVLEPRTALYASGSWADQVGARLADFVAYRSESFFIVPMCTFLFLAGSRLVRAGAFDDTAAGARIRRALMVAGLALAAPLNLLTAYAGPTWFLVNRYVLPPVVALGLLALVTTVVLRTRGRPGLLRRGLSAVGRTALSCYVLQNLCVTAICYGWGLGLAARFAGHRFGFTVGLWTAVSVVSLVLASVWLHRFGRGPLELVWHRLWEAPQPHRDAGPAVEPPPAAGAGEPRPVRAPARSRP